LKLVKNAIPPFNNHRIVGNQCFKDMKDEDLVAEIQRTGDTAMFGEIYRRYVRVVLSKAMSIVMNKPEAEDMAHDVFLKLYQNIGKYKQTGSFSSWFNTFTYNFCFDHYRRSKKTKWTDIEFVPEQGEEDMEYGAISEKELFEVQVERLQGYMLELNAVERGVLLMKYKDDLSVNEIATALKISNSAVKMRLKRARDKILLLENEPSRL
jgi:RNA polymerase sigma factor (sigma-70 family)